MGFSQKSIVRSAYFHIVINFVGQYVKFEALQYFLRIIKANVKL